MLSVGLRGVPEQRRGVLSEHIPCSTPLYSPHNGTKPLILEGCTSPLCLLHPSSSSSSSSSSFSLFSFFHFFFFPVLALTLHVSPRGPRGEKGNETLIEMNENVMKWRTEYKARRENKNQLLYSSCPYLLKGPGDVLRWPFDRLFVVYCSAPSSLRWHRAGAARVRLEPGIWRLGDGRVWFTIKAERWEFVGGGEQDSKSPKHPLMESVRSILTIRCDCTANSAAPIQPRSPTGFSHHSAPSCPLCLALGNRALNPPPPHSPSLTLLPIAQCSSERL